jgi:hypothetical protein
VGAPVMTKLKIGYWPLTETLKSAGDRRRLVFWAKARGHSIVTDLTQKVDVIIASENADFNSNYFRNEKIPVIFDLVDAYLSPLSSRDDLARGIAKKLSGQISGTIKPYSHHVEDFCRNATLVICSSIEQELLIKSLNTKTSIILDSHEEIPFISPLDYGTKRSDKLQILWEGQPATISGVGQIASSLDVLSNAYEMQFNFVTDYKYYKLLNRYFERNTLDILKKNLPNISKLTRIIPWSPENLASYARSSNAAIIPIDLSVPMQALKPENRLLIMWRLGLPCLTSPSPAYVRVANKAGVNAVCENLSDWSKNFSQLLEDKEYAKNEVLKGQEYLHENHNGKILLKKWDMVFESVLG